MNFICFFFITLCSILTETSYASNDREKQPVWNFPVLRAIGKTTGIIPTKIKQAGMPKNLSEDSIAKIIQSCDWEEPDLTSTIETASPIAHDTVSCQDPGEFQISSALYTEQLKAIAKEISNNHRNLKPIPQSMETDRNSYTTISTAQANEQITWNDLLCCCNKKKTNS